MTQPGSEGSEDCTLEVRMRRFTIGSIAEYALVLLGLFVSMLNAYLLGQVRGSLSVDSSAALVRLQGVQHTSIVGVIGGVTILAIGHVLLYRSLVAVDSHPS